MSIQVYKIGYQTHSRFGLDLEMAEGERSTSRSGGADVCSVIFLSDPLTERSRGS